MKKLLILLFSLGLIGLNAQNNLTKKQKRKATKAEKNLKTFTPAEKQYQANYKKKNNTVQEIAKKGTELPVFEGAITLVNSDPKGLTGVFLVEGKKVAATLPTPTKEKAKYIIENATNTEINLTTQQGKKVAIKQRRAAFILPKGVSVGRQNQGKKQISKTGKTQQISGYKCQEVIVKDNLTYLTAWVTTEVPIDFKSLMPTTASAAEYLNVVNSRSGIPNALVIKATQKDIQTGKTFTISTQVEKKKIRDKQFEIPKGYRLVDQTRASRKVRNISPAARVGAAQSKAKEALKQMAAARKAAAAKEAKPAEGVKSAPVKE